MGGVVDDQLAMLSTLSAEDLIPGDHSNLGFLVTDDEYGRLRNWVHQ